MYGDFHANARFGVRAWIERHIGIDIFEQVVIVVLRQDALDTDLISSVARLKAIEELYIVKRSLLRSDVNWICTLKQLRLLYLGVRASPCEQLLDTIEHELPQCTVVPMVVKDEE